MPRVSGQKQKLLYLKRILERESSEAAPITIERILARLDEEGISAERKSIYRDLVELEDFGMEIVRVRQGRTTAYYATTGLLELPELKLLVDAVQSSRFITKKKSEELIEKLAGFVSDQDARILRRQVYTTNRIKAENEAVYYAVDELHTAIAENKQVSFRYFSWDLQKKKVLRHNGAIYRVSPWALIWDDEYYYMVAYDHAHDEIRHYRVDKMLHVSLINEPRKGREHFGEVDPATYSQRMFGMFGGEEVLVTLRCKNQLVDVILDRFGTGVSLHPATEDTFEVTTRVANSPNFRAWDIGFGDRMRVVQPQRVADEIADMARRALHLDEDQN